MKRAILAIDQGTTSSRAIVFDKNIVSLGMAQQEFTQHFPANGWVEHDPEEIWKTTIATCRAALKQANMDAKNIASIGITNQRETIVVWDKTTGKPLYNAIVWQDRRTSDICQKLKNRGYEKSIREKTGLLLDPYFSATKIAWILDNVEGARTKAKNGTLQAGTIDSFLLWRLTNGRSHKTDATNASRTMLYDIHKGSWCSELCKIFNIPLSMLPEVKDCTADFGMTDPQIFGHSIPVSGIAGDQQAATIGQACFLPGMIKATYGTGCFALLNTGEFAITSKNKLLTTIAYQFDGKPTYALEGSVFIAGAAVQWLRDGIKIIDDAKSTATMAAAASEDDPVYFVPAFVGLGAPYWDADCRGALFGLTRATGRNEIAKATLESVCYQTCDLLGAMQQDWQTKTKTVLRVDGGMAASNWTMQCLSNLLNAPVDRPARLETTALGAAYLAGKKVGFYDDITEYAKTWAADQQFTPKMNADTRQKKMTGWHEAVRRTLSS